MSCLPGYRTWVWLLVALCLCCHGNCTQYEDEEVAKERSKRVFSTEERYLWPKMIVPYEDTSNNPEDVQAAIATFEHYSPFRFLPPSPEVAVEVGHKQYLRWIINYGRGFSYVGRANIYTDYQELSCPHLSTCIHEVGHALGFHHEQTHPNRDNWIRLNKDAPYLEPSSFQLEPAEKGAYGEFDVSSIMLYGPMSVKRYSLLFPEFPIRFRMFYFFKELCTVYKCHEHKICLKSKRKLQCSNEGFVSVVDGVCTCICPPGLESSDGCKSTTKSGNSFPSSTYALLMPNAGCPAGFDSRGSLQHYGLGENRKSWDNFVGEFADHKVELNFCTKTREDDKKRSWPAGQYCFLQYGDSCPKQRGIYNANLTIPGRDDTSQNRQNGGLPSGKYNDKDVVLDFCCVYTGLADVPIKLSGGDKPFILFARKGRSCQKIEGMHITTAKFGINRGSSTGDLYTSRSGKLLNVRYCVYKPYNRDCGEVIDLGNKRRTVTIESDQKNPSFRQCTWLVQNSEGKGTVVIDVEEFRAHPENSRCGDSLEVQPNRIGQTGHKFCKTMQHKTMQSLYGKIWLQHTTSEDSKSYFKATFKWIPDEDMCYNVKDYGRSYRGTTNVAQNGETCLPWSETMSCQHSTFEPGDVEAGLDSNYCRNPNGAFRPWCFTKLEGCERSFCDVCQLEKQNQIKNSVKVTQNQCHQPGSISDGAFQGPSKSRYEVGDRVTYKCANNENTIERTCLSTGHWSAAGTACLACPPGYSQHTDSCFQFFFEKKTYDGAVQACKDRGALLAMPKTKEKSDFLAKMKYPINRMWLGLSQKAGVSKWSDGTLANYFNWKYYDVPHPFRCVFMRMDDTWRDVNQCSAEMYYTCEKPALGGNKIPCKDFLDNCPDVVRRSHYNCDLAPGVETYCRHTCTQCSTDCHKDIQLTETSNTYSISSNTRDQQRNKRCSWTIKAPNKKGRLTLQFEEFDIKPAGEDCFDSVEVRSHETGAPFTRFCNGNYKSSVVVEDSDTMYVKFRTPQRSNSNFKASIKWVADSDMCYNVADKGWSYDGNVKNTENQELCLSWPQALTCVNNTLQSGYFLENLSDNNCRNPDNSDRPWCYSKNCEKQFCDVCYLKKKKDVSSNCQQFKNAGKCQTDPEKAVSECAHTCTTIIQGTLRKVKNVQCSKPGSIFGGKLSHATQNRYDVGDKVTYSCDNSQFTVERTCLTSGSWSKANTACLECPYGFIPFGAHCYKYFNQYVDKKGAIAVCKENGGVVATAENKEQNEFISQLRNDERIWLGGIKNVSRESFVWNDNSKVDWSNWFYSFRRKPFKNRDTCMVMEKKKRDNTWTDDWCKNKLFHFVCQVERVTDKAACEDFIDNCPSLVKAVPNSDCTPYPSLQMYCRATCKSCSKKCNKNIGLSINNPTYSVSVKPGEDYCTWAFGAENKNGRFWVTVDQVDDKGTMSVSLDKTKNRIASYTRSDYKKATEVVGSRLYLVYKTKDNSQSELKATVRWITDSGSCYNKPDKGWSYNGKISYTKDFQACKPWSETKDCPYNPLKIGHMTYHFENNYCRNPDGSEKPWCYVGDCQKRFCDVCHAAALRDIATDCEQRLKSGQCSKDSIDCAATCNIGQYEKIQQVSAVSCRRPGDVPKATIKGTVKSLYNVGEQVEYRCNDNFGSVQRTCLSTGEWSVANTACMRCPMGFLFFQGNCYKYVDMKVDYKTAEKECEKLKSRIATSKTVEENAFLVGFRNIGRSEIWLGAQKDNSAGKFMWNDNTPVTLTKFRIWKTFERRDKCIRLSLSNKLWRDDWCHQKALNFVCKRKAEEKFECRDFQDNCKDLISYTGKQSCEPDSHLETLCPFTCGVCPRDCAQDIVVSNSNFHRVISSDRRRHSSRICTWNFDTQGKQGQFVLRFEEFDVAAARSGCIDELIVRKDTYGAPIKRHCNNNKAHVLNIDGDKLVLEFRTAAKSSAHFKISVKWISNDDLCYSSKDKGKSYSGTVTYTENFRTCLPWTEALSCGHHPFQEKNFFDNLDGNYCRNPDKSERPWCYVDKYCRKQYCDVCHLAPGFDVGQYCDEIGSKGGCKSDPKEALKCAATCGVVPDQQEPSVKNVQCQKPGPIFKSNVDPKALKDSYTVGESVTYKCERNGISAERTCLSTGSWSPLATACLSCPPGWKSFGSSCYKRFDTELEFSDSSYECNKHGGIIANPKNANTNKFLVSLMNRNPVWIGLRKGEGTTDFTWSDGESASYFNWENSKDPERRDLCTGMNFDNGKWKDDWCSNVAKHFICETKKNDNVHCVDVIQGCQNLVLKFGKKCDAVLNKFCYASCNGCRSDI